MPKAISHSTGNHGDGRIDGCEKCVARRSAASMMADLEHVRMKAGVGSGKQFGFFFVFGISYEKKRALSVSDSDHERVVVGATIGRNVRTRSKHVDVSSAELVGSAQEAWAEHACAS